MPGNSSKFIQLDGKQISFLKKYFGEDAEKTERVFDFYYGPLDYIQGCDFDLITNHVIDLKIDVRDGDVLVFCDPHLLYRNSGKCMWSNGRAIGLSYEGDEYGEVAPCFEIKPDSKFYPRYWEPTITHNINYWPCAEYRKQCCLNMTVNNTILRTKTPIGPYMVKNGDLYTLDANTGDQTLVVPEYHPIRYTWFTHNGTKEYVVMDPECDVSEDEFKTILLDTSRPIDGYYTEEYFLQDMTHTNTSMVYKKSSYH